MAPEVVIFVAGQRFVDDKFNLEAAEFFRKICKCALDAGGGSRLLVDLPNFPGGSDGFDRLLKALQERDNRVDGSNVAVLRAASSFLEIPLLDRWCDVLWIRESRDGDAIAKLLDKALPTLTDLSTHAEVSLFFSDALRFLSMLEESLDKVFEKVMFHLSSELLSLFLSCFFEKKVLPYGAFVLWGVAKSFVTALHKLIFKVGCVQRLQICRNAGLFSEFLLKHFQERVDLHEEHMRKLPDRGNVDDTLDGLLAIFPALALLDFLAASSSRLKKIDRNLIKALQIDLFGNLLPCDQSRRTGFPDSISALSLARNFARHQPEYTRLAVHFMEVYLQESCPGQMNLDEFLEVAGFISDRSTGHDILCQEINRFIMTSIEDFDRDKLRELLAKVDCAKLFELKLESVVLDKLDLLQSFRREMRLLDMKIKRKCSYCFDIPTSSSDQDSTSEEECEHQRNQHQLSRKNKRSKRSSPETQLWITVVSPTTGSSYTAMFPSNASVRAIKRKVAHELVSNEKKWQLCYNGVALDPRKTIHHYCVGDFSVLTIQGKAPQT